MDKKTIVISDIMCNAVHGRVNRDASQNTASKTFRGENVHYWSEGTILRYYKDLSLRHRFQDERHVEFLEVNEWH